MHLSKIHPYEEDNRDQSIAYPGLLPAFAAPHLEAFFLKI